MAYTGSVELISGIRQKNGQDFPLVDASAVRVDDETRLDDALSGLSVDVATMGRDVERVGQKATEAESWMKINNFDSVVSEKTNVLLTPYDYETSGFLNNAVILSDGTIRQNGGTDNACLLSPLIAVEAGTYGLKTQHTNQSLGDVVTLNGGFGLFASDGTTAVSKPTARTDIGNDIYLFEIPQAASYIRFVIGKGTKDDTNIDRAVDYFNRWILLPNADSTIDDSFFVLASKKENGSISSIKRKDGSYLTIQDQRIGDLADLDTTKKSSIVDAINEACKSSDSDSEVEAWMDANDFIGNHKSNILLVPYTQSDIINAASILSNGSIRTGTSLDNSSSVTPLIRVDSGFYGLKTQHNSYDCGQIASGNNYKNGFSFFALDGETIVARPSDMQSLGNDIYLFEVPSDAQYVRFSYITGGINYQSAALDYFNQWILLPDADSTIDDSFFEISSGTSDDVIYEIKRKDGSYLTIQDQRIGDLADLDTTKKSSIVDAINEACKSSGGNGEAESWMKINNFDSVVDGKVNVLLTPYDYETSGFLNNAVILSDGTIRQNGGTDNACLLSPLIAVEAGTYGLKTQHTNQSLGDVVTLNGGFGLFASDGTTAVSKPTARTDIGNDIYLFEVPGTASYIRFVIGKGTKDDTNIDRAVDYFNQWILLPDADNTIDDSFFVLASKKENGTISQIRRKDGSYLEIVDSEVRSNIEKINSLPITFGRRTCAIFEKVCCIGDSFTEGYIMNTSGVAVSKNEYSWVTHMAKMTGREYVNLGISGATVASWLTSERGLAKMLLPENKSQAYLIGLQINDAATDLTIGTISDIGTDTVSYYGCMSKIIDQIFTVNDLAHVFIQTQPKNFTGVHTPYRNALLSIVEWYQTEGNGTHQNQVHLIDLLDYWELYRNPGCIDSMANGHYTAVGWEYCAEILMYAWSNYINAHPLVFQDVNLIPFN